MCRFPLGAICICLLLSGINEEVRSDSATEKVRLLDPSLTSGIPGDGSLLAEQVKVWLADKRNHIELMPELPVGLSAGASLVQGLKENPLTRAKIELGRQLYFDPKLSAKKQEEMLRENDHGDIVDTAVHEAYPGHHLQLSFAAKNTSKIRKAYDAAIFSEGWALYSEELMAELGYYTPEERLMQLEWTLVRAARIVLDVGLHTKGMSFDEAVRFLTDKVHLEHELAVSEVKRYTMTPTQPLAYLTGRQAIFGLRERYKSREKEKFSLKRFHAELLTRGTIPPGLLARELFAE